MGNIIEVGSPEYKHARAPDVLKTDGIGICLVAGVVYGDKGYLLHTHSPDRNMPPVREFFSALRRDIPESERPKSYVILGGGSQDFAADKKLLEERILSEGFKIDYKQWNKPNTLQALTLDLGNRKAIFNEEEYDDINSPEKIIGTREQEFRF